MRQYTIFIFSLFVIALLSSCHMLQKQPIAGKHAGVVRLADGTIPASVDGVSLSRGDTSKDILGEVDSETVEVNVKNFGAKGDGVSDDSLAFIRAIDHAEKKFTASKKFGGSSNKIGKVSIYIPSGDYVITENEAIIRSSFATRTIGLYIRGAGKATTTILYKPTTPGGFLLNNQDAWLHVKITDIEFNGNSLQNSFMRSYSQGGAQNYYFESVNWSGAWKHAFLFEGTDTNSENTWMHCGFYGTYDKVVYVPSSSGSDQFLNYNFFATQCEIQSGDFLNFEKGGNISVWGGSFIHINATGGTFFKFNTNVHSYGVQRFLCIGGRFEQRFEASKLCDIAWDGGVVSFINCDMSSSTPFVPKTAVMAKFKSGGQKMSSVKFDNCYLMGRHEFEYGVASWSTPHNIVYENCEMTGASSPAEFTSFVATGGHANLGGIPVIDFRNCRGSADSAANVWDTDLGFSKAIVGVGQKKVISIKNAQGKFPTNGQTVKVLLPVNSIITKITLYSPKNAVGSAAAANFKVQTAETTPTILADVSVPMHKDGFNVAKDMTVICDTAQKSEIQLVGGAGVDQANPQALCLIEYI